MGLVVGGAVGVVALAASPAAAATTTKVVSSGAIFPGNPIGAWLVPNNTGTFSFVAGPGSPPAGVGSLAVSATPANHESVYNYAYGACATPGFGCADPSSSWTKLADINALSYSTYRTSGDQAAFPTFNIEIDPNPGGGGLQHFTTLVFIPNYPSVVNSTWQTWDAMNPSNGTWYSSKNLSTDFPGSPFACQFQVAGCNASWSQIQAAYPLARVSGGLGPNVGSGGNFVGNVDNFTVGTSSPAAATIFDFEPVCTTVCYVSNSGSDSSTGVSPSQAFLTIQHAVNTVSAGGTVNVAAGTYNESVNIPKAVTLNGANAGNPGTGPRGAESLVNRTAGQSGPVFNVATANPVVIDGFNEQFTGTPSNGDVLLSILNGNVITFENNVVNNSTYVNTLLFDDSAASATFTNNLFTNLTQTSGPGTGVLATWGDGGSGTQAAVSITGNTFSNLNDNDGVPAINLNTMKGAVSGNTFQNIHQYGIILADKLGPLSITNNLFDNIINSTPLSSQNRGSGIRTFSTPNFVAPVTITLNTFSNSYHGVRVANDGSPANIGSGNLVVNRNSITTMVKAGLSLATGTAGTLNGTCNWWGTAAGPGVTGTDVESGPGVIDASTWLASSNLNGACASGPGTPTISAAFASDSPDPSPISVFLGITGSNGGSPITTYSAMCVSLSVPPNPTVYASGPGDPLFVGGLMKGGYQCTVAVTNAFGTSAASAPFTIFVGGTGNCTAIPTAPGTPSTAPGNASATVSWAPSTDCVAGYVVTPYLGSTPVPELAKLVTGPGTTTVIKGLTNGASYHFTIAAENGFAAGPASAATATITVGAPAAAAVTNVSRAALGSLRVAFTVPRNNGAAITSYTATCASKNGGKARAKSARSGPVTVAGLTSGRSYTCTVRATNSRGTGPASRASGSVAA